MSTKLIKIVKTFGVFVKKTCYINKSEKKKTYLPDMFSLILCRLFSIEVIKKRL